MRSTLTAAGLALIALTVGAQAQDDAGRNEYIVACAVCHGESGKGDGPFAPVLNISVPSLTGLSAANEGNFPFLETFMMVDGRTQIRGHGSPMPVWGDRYTEAANDSYGPYGAEVVTRGRILSLIYYLESIQE